MNAIVPLILGIVSTGTALIITIIQRKLITLSAVMYTFGLCLIGISILSYGGGI